MVLKTTSRCNAEDVLFSAFPNADLSRLFYDAIEALGFGS